jgi:hypothetical protein
MCMGQVISMEKVEVERVDSEEEEAVPAEQGLVAWVKDAVGHPWAVVVSVEPGAPTPWAEEWQRRAVDHL